MDNSRIVVSISLALLVACGSSNSSPTNDAAALPVDGPGVDTSVTALRACDSGYTELLRTPDERFAGLAGFDFAPHYVNIGSIRIHYLDEGPADGALVLLTHGEPTWSYLSRKMIPVLTAAGYRVIAPDLVGFGRSDKPANRDFHTYQRQVDCMHAFIEALDLNGVTLFGQDWGGLIFLRVAAEDSARFDRIVASNTMLITGEQEMSQAFYLWRDYSQVITKFSEILGNDPAYDAPFPDETFMAGGRELPLIVPISPDDPAAPANRAAWAALGQWQKPFLTAFGATDPIAGSWDVLLQEHIPGAAGQPHLRFADAGHFVQEDVGAQLAQVIIDFIVANPAP